MVGCVGSSGGEGNEVGDGANGIEDAFEGGMSGDDGLKADSVERRGVLARANTLAGKAVHGASQAL